MPKHSFDARAKEFHHGAVRGRRLVRPTLAPHAPAPERPRLAAALVGPDRYNGKPTDVMLQGFHWNSWASDGPNWYQILAANAKAIRDAGFDVVWFPPPSEAAFGGQGYMPTRWDVLDTAYGTRADLAAAVQALKPLRCLADVVVNHRCGVATGGADFDGPPFPLAKQTDAVCKDDESGVGTGAADTGEGQVAARDLDHTSPGVRDAVKQYLKNLKAAGFAGWRYDEVRGYAGGFVGEYNDASKPYLSVGEFWDADRQRVIDWVDATGGRSMAFDFPTRALLKAALRDRDFGLLKTADGKPSGAIGFWPAMCVTFIENHDTEKDHPHPDEFGPGDQVVQGYAYLLTHPGLPCVFWSHFFDYGPDIGGKIRALLNARKQAGLTSGSVPNIVAADGEKYAAVVDDKVAVKLGPAPWDPGPGWRVAVDGNDFAVWTRPA